MLASTIRNYRVAAVIGLTSLLSACGDPEQTGYKTQEIDVDFIEVKPASAVLEKKYPGVMEGTVNVEVKAQVSGYLDEIYVKEGDYVKKGQSLFRIKGDVFQEQVNNSEAALKSASSAEESARIELEKIKPLVEGKVYSELQLQTAEANYAAAKAQVAQAKAALGSSRINAAFSLIKAPVSGYIGRIPNRIGNLVSPADLTPLTSLSEIDQVLVYFSLSEPDFMAYMKDSREDKSMNTVELITADGSLYSHKGVVEIASGNIDRTTGSIPLKAVFPNPDKLLRSGGMGKVVLKKIHDNALSIPMSSVKDIQNKFFVFVLSDSNTVAMRAIEINGRSGINYIVQSGLSNGEQIALNRIDVLTDKMVVKPTQNDVN